MNDHELLKRHLLHAVISGVGWDWLPYYVGFKRAHVHQFSELWFIVRLQTV